jgi:hypothetical protein
LANGSVILETYDEAVMVNDVTMMGRIEKTSGFIPMPPSGQLSTCNITLIRKWIEQGKPE